MDRTADPCRDFYTFSNGKWLTSNPVPPDRSRWGAFDEVTERNLLALKQIAEEAAENGTTPKRTVRLVGDFYASGMNEGKIEQAGKTPIANELERIDTIRNPGELIELIAHQHRLGIAPLFSFSVDQDYKNATRNVPHLMQGGLGLPDRDYYTKSDARTKKIRAEYLEHVNRMFRLLGDAPGRASAEAQTVLAMETQLARASRTNVEMRDPQRLANLLRIADLDRQNGTKTWQRYFTAVGAGEPGDINVAVPEFIRVATRMLPSTPIAQWKTYLRWHLVNATAGHLSQAFVDEDFRFKGKILAGQKEIQPRWKRVLGTIDHGVGDALGELYVVHYFSPEAKTRVVGMVTNIKAAMADTITSLDWMSAPTREMALRKLGRMNVKIGYPDNWRDYTGLEIEPDTYLANTLRANEFEFKRNLAKIGKPVDRTEWQMTAPTVNAYYNPTMNEMVFPAGILQPPFFDPAADDATNYGSTGATIGHELTHGFDDEGRQFYADGNLRNWWTPQDEKNFLARTVAIEKQFDEFVPIDNIHINGKLTAGENIADLGGLKIAHKAMQKSLARMPVLEPIDGFTPEQRFFLAYAQSNRENLREERLRLQLATDPHSPAKYRVMGPLANLPEFNAAFACTGERSQLRPEKLRVNIW